jgi:hypothetical protein
MNRLKDEMNRLKDEINREKDRRKALIQGELLKNSLRDNNLWDSFVYKDQTWMQLPPEVRTYLETKITNRNNTAHPDLQTDAD